MSIDPATAAAGLAEAMGGPLATESEIERIRDRQAATPRAVRWRRFATVDQIQYQDGGGDLCNVVTREPEGLRIVGNGTLQAPLSVEVLPGWRLVRNGEA